MSAIFEEEYEPEFPACVACRHKHPTGPTCTAFPAGIPDQFLEGLSVHDSPYPGDGGIMFEPRPGTEKDLYIGLSSPHLVRFLSPDRVKSIALTEGKSPVPFWRGKLRRVDLTGGADFPDPPEVRARLDQWNRSFIRRRYAEDEGALREEHDRLAADIGSLHPADRAGWPALRGLRRWETSSS